ncbi:unnamed protein product [Amoebophrya sp. A120]|nr:unnamed protein product [Amoebophrya sp. A120]|eukprot:GSA120T00006752001.1
MAKLSLQSYISQGHADGGGDDFPLQIVQQFFFATHQRKSKTLPALRSSRETQSSISTTSFAALTQPPERPAIARTTTGHEMQKQAKNETSSKLDLLSRPSSFAAATDKPLNCDLSHHGLGNLPSPEDFCTVKRNGADADDADLKTKEELLDVELKKDTSIAHYFEKFILANFDPYTKIPEKSKKVKILEHCLSDTKKLLQWLTNSIEDCKKKAHDREPTSSQEPAELVPLAANALKVEEKGVTARQALERDLKQLKAELRKAPDENNPQYAPCDAKKGPPPRPWCIFLDGPKEREGEDIHTEDEVCTAANPETRFRGQVETNGPFMGSFGANIF